MTDAIHVTDRTGTIVAWATRDCVTGEVRMATQCNNERRRVDIVSNWEAVCRVLQQLQEALKGQVATKAVRQQRKATTRDS